MSEPLILLYNDCYMVAIDKPSGLIVHKTGMATDRRTCMNNLRDQLDQWVYPVHRLDRKTSGVLLFALDKETAGGLSELFRDHKIHKTYITVVRGWVEEAGTLDDPLKRTPDGEKQLATTHYRPLARMELPYAVGPYQTARYSLLEVEPVSGRRHQIRRHLNHFAHPVVGDAEHGEACQNRIFREKLQIDRLMLHCTRISFMHPRKSCLVQIDSPAPIDFENLFTLFNYSTPT